MKKYLLIALSLCAVYAAQAQAKPCFTYDAAGNRIKRQQCTSIAEAGDREQPTATQPNPASLLIVPNPSPGLFTLRTEGLPPEAHPFSHHSFTPITHPCNTCPSSLPCAYS